MRRAFAALLSFALLYLMTGAPAFADRVVIYNGQLGVSTEQNQGPRFLRLAFGTWIRDALGPTTSAGGIYANLSLVPNGGMYVATQPTLPSTLGSLYQIAVDDANPVPATGATSLAADSTKIVVQATQGGTSASLGPLTAPGSGLSQYYLIEAQVQTVDTTPTTLTFTSASGSYTNTVPITRADQIVYQVKAGTASSSPAVPTVDTGWIGIATVLVPSGTSTITTGMIAPLPSFTGFLTNGQAASVSALTLQGFSTGCLQVVAGGSVQSLPCTSGLGAVYGTSGQVNVSTVGGTATIALAHGDYADLVNAQTIGGAKTLSTDVTLNAGAQIPAAGTATNTTNYASAGSYALFNSIWNGSSAVSSSWTLTADNAGNLLSQYNATTQGELSSTGTATFSNLILSALSASTCVGTNSSKQLVSASGCLATLTAGTCLASSGGTSPTISLQTPLPITCGGTDAASFTSGALLYYNGTSVASASVSSPLGFSAGALGCSTCVTAVSGSGNIASSGGTTPSISFTGVLPIANGGGNAASYTSGDLLYYDGTKFDSAPIDYNVTHSGALTSGVSLYATLFNDSGLTASLPVCTDSSKDLTSTCTGLVPIASLVADTISGVALGNNLASLSCSSPISCSSYNGSASQALSCPQCGILNAANSWSSANTFSAALIGNAGAATPSPAPTGYNGPTVIAQATSAPTAQPGYVKITGTLSASELIGSGAGLSSGTIPIASLVADTISGVSLGNSLAALSCSSPISCSSYTGASAQAISLTTVPISLGGTNATSFANSNYLVAYNGTSLVAYTSDSNPAFSTVTTGTAGSYTNNALYWGTGGSYTQAEIWSNGSSGAIHGIYPSSFGIYLIGGGNMLSFDQSGNLAINDAFYGSNLYNYGIAASSLVCQNSSQENVACTVGNGLAISGTTPSVSGCGNATCRTGFEPIVGSVSGTVSTSDTFYEYPVLGFSSPTIVTLWTDCTTPDNGTSVATFYRNGSSIGTVTLGSSDVTTVTISAVTLSSGDKLKVGITTQGGPGSNCMFGVAGYQNLQ